MKTTKFAIENMDKVSKAFMMCVSGEQVSM